jgi:hypothetical protein
MLGPFEGVKGSSRETFGMKHAQLHNKKLYPMISEVDIGMDKERILQGYFSS